MGRKKDETNPGGSAYRKRAGKQGLTVSVTEEEKRRLRMGMAAGNYRSLDAFLLDAGLRLASRLLDGKSAQDAGT